MAESGFIVQNRKVIDWLLENEQPSVRYYTLMDILDRKEDDPDVVKTFSQIPRKGWARDMLLLQKPGGYWEPKEPGEPTERTLL